jgi:predicted ATPase
MRATGLKLERFKIVSSAELRLAPITLLIGGNNTGKSTVLQALALLAQSVDQPKLQTWGPYVDLGGTPAALLNRSSRVGEGWSIEVSWEDVRGRDQPVEISFLCRSGAQDPTFTSEGRVRLQLGGGVTVRAWDSAVGPRLEVDGPAISAALGPAELRSNRLLGHLPTPANVDLAVPPVTGNILADADSLSATRAMSAPYLDDSIAPTPGIARALGSYRYVGPDRHFNRGAYNLSDTVADVPLRQEDLANALAYDREVRRGVDQRCREIFGFGISADFAQGRNVDLVATSDDGGTYSLNHMGSGFGQVVWIAVYLELQRRAAHDGLVPLVGIEEAELHLHPAAQPAVARMLASYAQAGVQQILTTQSEHLLIALLQLVTTGELEASDLAVYHMDRGAAERLEVDERGRLSGGLKGFFEANEDELLAHLDALIHT